MNAAVVLYRVTFRLAYRAMVFFATALLAVGSGSACAAAEHCTENALSARAVTAVSLRSHDVSEGRFTDHDRLFVVAGGEAIQVWETTHWQLVREFPIYGVAGFPFYSKRRIRLRANVFSTQ